MSVAAHDFKLQIEQGQVPPDYLREIPLCMESLNWIFNATREPHVGVDQVRKYPGSEFMVVLRRGHIFRVDLFKDDERVTVEALEVVFDEILEQADEHKTLPATLTAGDRDGWAKVRLSLIQTDHCS